MRRLPIAFILAIFLPLICACGDEPHDYGDFLTDIVTYEGSSDDGTAMFSFQSRDDLPLQRLASSIKLPSDGNQPMAQRHVHQSERMAALLRQKLSADACRRRADARQPDNRGAHCLQHDGRADIVRPPCICLFRRFCPMEPRHMPTPVDRHRRPHVRL